MPRNKISNVEMERLLSEPWIGREKTSKEKISKAKKLDHFFSITTKKSPAFPSYIKRFHLILKHVIPVGQLYNLYGKEI